MALPLGIEFVYYVAYLYRAVKTFYGFATVVKTDKIVYTRGEKFCQKRVVVPCIVKNIQNVAYRNNSERPLQALPNYLFGIFFFQKVAEIERHYSGKYRARVDIVVGFFVEKVPYNFAEIVIVKIHTEILDKKFRNSFRPFCKNIVNRHIA